MRVRNRDETAFGERTPGICAIECAADRVQDHLYATCEIIGVLGRSRDGIGGVLDKFKKCPVCISADSDGLLVIGVLDDQVRLHPVGLDSAVEQSFYYLGEA